jgi:hypothetical protein
MQKGHQGKLKSRKGTINAWNRAINNRLNTDEIMATKILRRKEHIRLVAETWGDTPRK